jgi:hypothetical protein
MKYAIEMGSGVDTHTEFHEDWFRYSKVDRGEMQKDRHNMAIEKAFLQNKESGLKIYRLM